jgi:hypothetical protein
MGAKIGIIIAGIAGLGVVLWIVSQLNASNTLAATNAPNFAASGALPLTPNNPIPVNLTSLLPASSPSTVSPTGSAAATNAAGLTPAEQAAASAQAGVPQGPSYTAFLSQQNSADMGTTDLPLPSTISPSLVTYDNSIASSVVDTMPTGIDPPGISTDGNDYIGTGGEYYS